MEKRDSTIFYRSFYEAIKELPDINQLEVYNAIFEHSFNLKKPVLSGLTKTIYTLIEPQIEANLKRYANGNRPKKKQTESETEAKNKQEESKSEANKNKNKNNNENKNDNPSLVKKQIPKKVMFSESEFIDKAKFRDALPDWSVEKLRYYYDALLTWSNEGNKKIDWIATAKTWERKDVAEGKIKFNTLKTELPKNWWNMDLTPEQWKLVPKEKVAEKENQDIRRKMGI